jgi:hypothetical protein
LAGLVEFRLCAHVAAETLDRDAGSHLLIDVSTDRCVIVTMIVSGLQTPP